MKVHFITKHQLTDQSSRTRIGHYLEHFRRAGVDVKVSSFYTPSLQAIVYESGHRARKMWLTLRSLAQRFLEIREVGESDIVFVHREACPFFFTTIERGYYRLGTPIVYDFDDAVFLRIPSRYNPEIEWLRRPQKTQDLLRLASHVVVGNRSLADYASQYNANVTVIPTPVDLAFYVRRPASPVPTGTVTVGWMGSRFSAYYLKSVESVLRTLAARYSHVRIVLVDAMDVIAEQLGIRVKPWRRDEEVADLHSFDIGIMPLIDDGIARYKCSFKLLQYMAVGIPVVCTPLGMNAEVVDHGVNGFWANTPEEWTRWLAQLIEDPVLRRRFGDAGRERVEREYSVDVNFVRLLEVFEQVLARTGSLDERRGASGRRSASTTTP